MEGADFAQVFPEDVRRELPQPLLDRLAQFDREQDQIRADIDKLTADPALRATLLKEKLAAHRAVVRSDLLLLRDEAVTAARVECDNAIGDAVLRAREEAAAKQPNAHADGRRCGR